MPVSPAVYVASATLLGPPRSHPSSSSKRSGKVGHGDKLEFLLATVKSRSRAINIVIVVIAVLESNVAKTVPSYQNLLDDVTTKSTKNLIHLSTAPLENSWEKALRCWRGSYIAEGKRQRERERGGERERGKGGL